LRTNKELYELFKSPLITTIMKINRLRLSWHKEGIVIKQTKNICTKMVERKRPRQKMERQRGKGFIRIGNY
jgi:hypothetical protein